MYCVRVDDDVVIASKQLNKTRQSIDHTFELSHFTNKDNVQLSPWHMGHGWQFFSDQATEGGLENLLRVVQGSFSVTTPRKEVGKASRVCSLKF